MTQDTIIAVSSPPGASWRGLLRLSGSEALSALDTLLEGMEAGEVKPGRMARARLRGSGLAVWALFFQQPRSFTGEDVVEIQMPGHPALLERTLTRAMQVEGVRLAEPGEFTYRAFASRRIDLTRAEGIAATIAATNDAQLRAAGQLRSGRLGRFAEQHVELLARLLALVEAGIDFTDQDDVVPIASDQLQQQLGDQRQGMTDLLSRCHAWSALDALPRVVLVGPPSAGKSTLFNALLASKRAVIDAMPGTTRDVLAEPWHVCGPQGQQQEVMLVDVAGLSPGGGPVEQGVYQQVDAAAQTAARGELERADVAVVLHPADGLDERLEWGLPDHVAQVSVVTKADLAPPQALAGSSQSRLQLSAVTGQGLEALHAAVWSLLGERGASVSGESMALGPRHERCLRQAVAGLDEAMQWLEPSVTGDGTGGAIDHVEMVAAGMRSALDELAALGGEMTPDDVIGKVFATFCVGK